jgi:hypothetical protein
MKKQLEFNKSDAIELINKMVNKMVNIKKDENGYFFYGGSKVNLITEGGNDIEDKHNLEIIQDNESRLRRVFKNHTNWSNLRNSQKIVGNHLRWCFCKIEGINKYPSTTTKIIPKCNFTCRKYYLPDFIEIHEQPTNIVVSFD